MYSVTGASPYHFSKRVNRFRILKNLSRNICFAMPSVNTIQALVLLTDMKIRKGYGDGVSPVS